jgi:hypothetical protein
MSAATVVTHSTGVNWGQAVATWLPIVLAIGGVVGGFSRMMKRISERTVEVFAAGLQIKFTDIQNHLSEQDKRFDRIDRDLGNDSR